MTHRVVWLVLSSVLLVSAAGAQRDVPLDRVHQVVQLYQVHLIDAQPVERAVDLLAGPLIGALARLRGKEVILAVPVHPGPDA